MIVQKIKATEMIEAEDVEERGSLADRVLFRLLKHPYQGLSDLSFALHAGSSMVYRHLLLLTKNALVEVTSCGQRNFQSPRTSLLPHDSRNKNALPLSLGEQIPLSWLACGRPMKQSCCTFCRDWQVSFHYRKPILKLIADAPRQLAYPGGYPAAIRWHWQRDYQHEFERKKKRMTFWADGAVVFVVVPYDKTCRRRALSHGTVFSGLLIQDFGAVRICA